MKITKFRLKQIIREELHPGVWYGPAADAERHRLLFPEQYEDEGPPLDPEKAAELAAVFGGDKAELSDDDETALEYAREADDEGWGWSSLEENKSMKIKKTQLEQIIREELKAVLNEARAFKAKQSVKQTNARVKQRGLEKRLAGETNTLRKRHLQGEIAKLEKVINPSTAAAKKPAKTPVKTPVPAAVAKKKPTRKGRAFKAKQSVKQTNARVRQKKFEKRLASETNALRKRHLQGEIAKLEKIINPPATAGAPAAKKPAKARAADEPMPSQGKVDPGAHKDPVPAGAAAAAGGGAAPATGAAITRGQARRAARKAGELAYTWTNPKTGITKKRGTRGRDETPEQWKKKMARRRGEKPAAKPAAGAPASETEAPADPGWRSKVSSWGSAAKRAWKELPPPPPPREPFTWR